MSSWPRAHPEEGPRLDQHQTLTSDRGLTPAWGCVAECGAISVRPRVLMWGWGASLFKPILTEEAQQENGPGAGTTQRR